MVRCTVVLLSIVVGFYCNVLAPKIPYVPEIVFTGYFNGDFDSLAGNWQWPNTCRLVGDTVRIYCYSTFFSESDRIRNGDLMRIDLYPDSGDGFEKRNTLFHLARYYESNESYTINRGDTVNTLVVFKSRIMSFSRSIDGAIELDSIYIATPPVKFGRHLEIKKGRLFGSIHR